LSVSAQRLMHHKYVKCLRYSSCWYTTSDIHFKIGELVTEKYRQLWQVSYTMKEYCVWKINKYIYHNGVKIALDEHNNQQNMQLTNTFSSSIKKKLRALFNIYELII
jgi:hypothetical protein